MQHEATERGSEVVGKAVIKHTAQDQIHGELTGDLVYGEVLTVQTHFSKQVQLVPEEDGTIKKTEGILFVKLEIGQIITLAFLFEIICVIKEKTL